MEQERRSPALRVEGREELRCPYCHDEVQRAEDKRGCDSCMAWHHVECWREAGACASCGATRETDGTQPPRCSSRGCEAPQLGAPSPSAARGLCEPHARRKFDHELRGFRVAGAFFAALTLASVVAAFRIDVAWWFGVAILALFTLANVAGFRHYRRCLEALPGAAEDLKGAEPPGGSS